MKTRNKLLIISIFIQFSTSVYCQYDVFKQVENYYLQSHDTLKIRILKFLEDNVDIHYSRVYYWQDSLRNKVEFDELSFEDYNASKLKLSELKRVNKVKPVFYNIPDRKNITKEQLIKTIDSGVNNWGKPWNKNLKFDDFCNYLLPYRSQNEPLEDWVNIFENRFSAISGNNCAEICNNVNTNLSKWFLCSFAYENRSEGNYMLSPSQMFFRKEGLCEDMCNLSVYSMRTLGLPVSIDFTPAWATSSYNHMWCTYIDEDGTHRPFEAITGLSNNFVIFREPGKVFRITYCNQSSSLANKIDNDAIPFGHLRKKNIIDVTNEYWPTSSINCRLFAVPSQNKISYISVFNSLRWIPVDWGKVNNDNVLFKNLSIGSVYLPINYEKGQIIVASNPVLIKSDKEKIELIPNYNNLISVKLFEKPKYLIYRIGKKYTFLYWDKKWINAGEKQATESKELIFDKIPSHTIYLLIPEYSQKKERIFTINDNNELEYW